MNLIAQLLQRAKDNSDIGSDYKLAKILEINPSAICNYRAGLSYPNDKILAALCALSKDDEAVMAAQVQAARAQSNEGKNLWMRIAKRLSSESATACLSVAFAISLVAGYSEKGEAATQLMQEKTSNQQFIHRIKYKVFNYLLCMLKKIAPGHLKFAAFV